MRNDEVGDVLRYALGGPPPRVSRLPGRSVRLHQEDLWVAAARAREPRADDVLLISKGLVAAGQGRAVRPALRATGEPYIWRDRRGEHTSTSWSYHLTVPSSIDSELPLQPTLARSESHKGFPPDDLEDWVGWLGLVTPRDLETTLTELVWPVLMAAEGFSVMHDATRVLAMTADHPGATGPLTAATLAAGLSAQRVDQRVLAVDAVSLMVARGQMSSSQLADGMTVASGFCLAPRWSSSLAELVPVTPAGFTFDVLVAVLPRLDAGILGLHSLLEHLLDEAARLGRRADDPSLRDWLGAITGSGRAARAARVLLAR
jgi:hypothetical protein